MIYGTVYDINSSLGAFDIVTLCSVLLHLRDPFTSNAKRAATVCAKTMSWFRTLPRNSSWLASPCCEAEGPVRAYPEKRNKIATRCMVLYAIRDGGGNSRNTWF